MRKQLHEGVRAAIASAIIAGFTAGAWGQADDPAVFVVNNVSDEITSFTANPDGTMVFNGNFPSSDGPLAAAISPDGRYLVVTHGTSNSIEEVLEIFRVDPDASLTMALSTTVPDASLGTVWLTDDIVAVTETDVGGANFVHAYRFDPAGPSLSLVDSGATGTFNTDLVVHPALPIVYAQDSLNNTVSWFGYTPQGMLAPRGVLPTGPTFPLRMAVLNDGTMLYAAGGISNGRHDVLGLRIDAAGDLTLHPTSPFFSPGDSPAYLAASKDDRFVFVGHGGDATVHTHRVEEDDSLTPTGFFFDVGTQGTLGDVEVLRGFLLITDEATFGDTEKGLYSFRINFDGSFTQVAPIYDTGGSRPETIVVWDPGIPGDINGDGVVDVLDLLALLAAWGPCPVPPPECAADINGDGVVDVLDLLELLANWS